MLAQNFKSPADLGLTDQQFDALAKTLVLLETEKVKHVPEEVWELADEVYEGEVAFCGLFNMAMWGSDDSHPRECGTIACIGGTAALISGDKAMFRGLLHSQKPMLHNLFFPNHGSCDWDDITVEQAGQALRNFLTSGDPRWDLIRT
jgi:hypothetical protein